MKNSENLTDTRLLKEIWQEYLKAVQQEEKERKLEEFLSSLLNVKYCENRSESELTSIGNLLGCELLKVISNQCEILEHDSDLVSYFQKGLGLYFLQSLYILADQVTNCNSEVSNVLVSILPCLLTVPFEFEDNNALAVLGKLSKLSSDVITGKRAVYSLYETSLPSQAVGATSKEVTVLQLFALLLDIISRLCSKGCSFAVAESSLNVADKLTTFLFEFVRSDGSRDSKNVRMKEDLPECVWTPTIKLVCVCMLLGPLWTVSVSRGGTDAFIHPIDQSELVRKLMKVLEKLKSIRDDKGLKGLKDVPAEELDIVVYRLFSMYSLLGLLLTLLKNSVTCKATAHSGLDSTRKLYIKELVGSFVQSGGSELLEFVSLSLNEVLSTGKKINSVCITLLKHKAAFVISMTSQLISALNKAKLAVTKSEDQKLHFSLDSVVSPIDPTRQEFRFSSGRSRSSQAFPVESSSDSDSDTQCTMNLGQHSCHSNKDCVVSFLCHAMFLVYEASAVEEIDLVCLNSLSRCGACCCMDISTSVVALLSRFVERTSHVQDIALGLLCKLLLRNLTCVRNNSSKLFEPPIDTAGSDEPLSGEANLATSLTNDRWSCLGQLFLLATEQGNEVTVKIFKHVKTLAKFGSLQLREALFTKVIFPFVLKYKDMRKVNALSQVYKKLSLQVSNPYDSGYGTPNESCDIGISQSEDSCTSQQPKPKTMISDDALRISLTSLLALLETDRSQRLFLNSGGVESIINFLGDESLNPICLGILEMLAEREERNSNSSKRRTKQDDSFKKRNHEMVSENRDPVVVNILLRLMFLLDPTKKEQAKSDSLQTQLIEFASKIRLGLTSPKVSGLLCQLWRSCLQVLRRNAFFRDLFVHSSGPSYVVVALKVVKEYLHKMDVDYEDNKDQLTGCVKFMERAAAVGLEFEEELVDSVQLAIQINEAVRIIQRLLHKDKLLKKIAGKTFCASLLNLAAGAVAEECSSFKVDVLDSGKLLFELENPEDSGSESDIFEAGSSNLDQSSLAPKDVEPGYEADAELDNALSDVSGKENGVAIGGVGREKEISPRRHSECVEGHIFYPQMCEQLVYFLEHTGEMTANDRALVTFGLEGIVRLASYSTRNREILCQQGIIHLVLKTFTPYLATLDVTLKAVQKTILDLITVLAGYEFSSEELKMYLKLLEANNPILGPLVKALRNVSSMSGSSHGPTYTHVFPAETNTTLLENSNARHPLFSTRREQPEEFNKKSPPEVSKRKKSKNHMFDTPSAYSLPRMKVVLPSSWCIKAAELKLNQYMPWPVGSFSLAFWLCLDSGLVGHGDRERIARTRIPHGKRSTTFFDSRVRDRVRKPRIGSFVHVVSFGSNDALFEVWVNFSKTELICRWSANSAEQNSYTGDTPPQDAFVKFPLKDYVWYHLVLSVRAGRDDDVGAGRVTLIMDGSSETTKPLRYPSIAVKKNERVSLLIGDIVNSKNPPRRFSEKLQARPICRLGSVSAFVGDLHRDGSVCAGLISMLNSSSKTQEKLRTVDMCESSYLHLLGANCQAIDFHLSERTSENWSKYLDLRILGGVRKSSSQSFLCGPHGEPILVDEQKLNAFKTSLRKQLILVYSPVNPSTFLEYKLEGTSWSGSMSYGDDVTTGNVINTAPLSVVRRKRFVEAIHSIGGIGVFLYLFAKIVEKTRDERAQADALSIIFTIAKENIVYAKELEGLVANKMILKVLLTPNCTPRYHFAKVFFSAACEGDVFRETGVHDKPYVVDLTTSAIIVNFEILRDFLLSWKIWYRSGSSLPWQAVLLALEALTNNTHPYCEFNMKQFERADALGILLLGCQEIQTEDLPFSSSLSSLHLNIIQNFLGCPANPLVLKRVCEFLVAVHPTHETLAIHAPGNLYFSPKAKLEDQNSGQEMEVDSYTVLSGRKGENAIDDNLADGKQGASEFSESHNGFIEGNPRSAENSSLAEQESLDGTIVMDITSNLSHGEIAWTNVLNTDDSKDMIISVEHLRETAHENADMQLPLHPPGLETKRHDQRHSTSSSKVYDNLDSSPQRPGLKKPNDMLSSPATGDHSEPAIISPCKVPARDENSYDMVSSSEFSASKEPSLESTNSNDDYVIVDDIRGDAASVSTYRHYRRNLSEAPEHKKLDELRIGLLELIYSALVNLADTAVDSVVGEVLKVEFFLCFVNHPASRIRTLSIEILNKILERASANVVNSFYKMSGYHLLANQIHLHPITQKLAEACFLLFFQQPVPVNQLNILESVKRDSELTRKINVQAEVPLLAMLEGATSSPEVFQFLTRWLVKLLDIMEDFLLKTTDHGLLKTLANAVRALCVLKIDNSGTRNDSETPEKIVLDHLQYLIMAIVFRSLRMCGDRYFQIFEDLLLSLDRLQYSEPGNKRLSTLLAQCSRFLQQSALRFALEYFEYSQRSYKIGRRTFVEALRLSFRPASDNEVDPSDPRTSTLVTFWTTLDSAKFPVLWQTAKTSLPAEATPTEVTSRFQDVCQKTVSFIYFSDTRPRVESAPYFNLSYSKFTLPSPFERYQQTDCSSLVNAHEIFTEWTFCFLTELLSFCLQERTQCSLNKRHELLYQSKDKIRHQLCRLFIYLMTPTQESKRKYFALQLTKMKHGNKIFLNLLLGAVTTKQRERAVAYVRAFLRDRENELTQEHKEVKRIVQDYLKDVEAHKSEKFDEYFLKQKQQEWEKHDHNNRIQRRNKKEANLKRLDQELHQLRERIMSVTMDVTKVSVDIQDKQRQNLLKHLKCSLSSDVQSQKLWQLLIKQMTHERAVWHDTIFFPTSWRLDRTEGPFRVRCRLQRCHLDVGQQYVMPEYRKQRSRTLPLSYLFEEHSGDASSKSVYHIFNSTDTIRFLHRCKSIMPARKVQGEILIGEKRVYFVGEEAVADLNTAQFFLDDEDVTSVSWLFQEIREILKRRYTLKDNALEIFLTNGRTFLLAFETTEDRETVYKELIAKELPNLITTTENLADLTQRWQSGKLTNFAYLTELNKQAGRSFNDLMQYPVFPLVLAEYSCDILDLTNRSVYRDLTKPIAVQNPTRVAKFRETYRSLQEQYDISKKLDPMNCIPPYHYGSHYSNSGTVLHFLVRLMPFTKMFLTYQDKQFDVPDRTFHAIETTWNLSSFASAPDVKELIPEFFFLHEFLLNSEGFDFGLRQNGERVMDVSLPSWACDNPRLFILIHRQALESDVVSSAINNWIDLVFGYKQTGQAAVDAVNVFHPSTYVGGIDENRLLEPLQRQAVQTMIETYGQTPAQLFSDPHPERKRSSWLEYSSYDGTFPELDSPTNQTLTARRSPNVERAANRLQEVASPVHTVNGIKWGQYVGSPSYSKPAICWSDSFPLLVSRLVCFPGSNLFLLPPNTTHMIVTRWKNKAINIVWSAVLSWNHVDDILRIRDIKKGTTSCFMENINLHKVSCSAVSEECRSLWVGSSTGCLCVWPTRYDRSNDCGLELLGRRIRLLGHQATITCIEICEPFSIVVTGSDDRTAIIWDLNRLCYIRCLPDHPTAVSFVAVSPTSGDIVTVCQAGTDNSSELHLWTVNGQPIKKIICNERITCVQFSYAPEGVSVNAIAAGLANGVVRLWNTWTLDHMCDIKDGTCQLPIVCLAYSCTSHHLFTADSNGTVKAWGRHERPSYKPRIFQGFH